MPSQFTSAYALLMVMLTIFAFTGMAAKGEQFFQSQDISVTDDDLFHYLKDRLNPEVYESALSKPDAMRNSLVNLYVIRKGALLAEQSGLVQKSELDYYRADGADRVALKYFIDLETEKLFDKTDWEALAEEQYIIDAEKYVAPEDVWVEHILISSEGRSFKELTERVAEVAGRIEDGAPFYELARLYSDDPSAERNEGDLGYVRRGQTVSQFEEMAFSMTEPGQISEPVLTRFGVHFIRFNEKRTAETVTFEKAKPLIIDELKKTRGSTFKAEVLAPFRLEGRDLLVDFEEEQLANQMFRRLSE